MADTLLTNMGVDGKTIRFLCDKVLYPDQRAIFIGKGKIVNDGTVRQGAICLTNRAITVYNPKEKRAYDFKLTELIDSSYKRRFFSSTIKIQMSSQETAEKVAERILIQGIPKGEEERVINLFKLTAGEQKRFEDVQKSKGMVRYGFSHEKWDSTGEAKRWLEQYLRRRGFKKAGDRWMTRQEYIDHKRKQKGLYKYIEAGIEKWGTLDKILDGLSPHEFEDFIGLLFKSMGYEVTNFPYVGDYGADLLVKRNGKAIVVQVKKYGLENNVGAPEVQKTLGSIWKYKASEAILVTTSTFTARAYEQATGAPIELWNREKLKEMLHQHLPSNLIQEKPVSTRLFPKFENICKSIITQAISYADSQTGLRVEFRIERGESQGKYGIKRKTLGFSVLGPVEYYPFLEKAMNECIPTIPPILKSIFEGWLNKSIKNELEDVRKKYSELTEL